MTSLVRPYPAAAIARARRALDASVEGEIAPLQALFAEAREALRDADPDEIDDILGAYQGVASSDKAAARAARRVAGEWEGIVTLGASIRDPFRFRGFAWAAASERYGLDGSFSDFTDGLDFPGVSAEDAALYVALPALVGLGPELPEEIPGPLPFEGDSVARLLGLGEADVEGVDPLDGTLITGEMIRSTFARLEGPWRAIAARCTECGMLVRPDT
jgi:hypothetical protein